ncbi:lipopolysaccharide biosynthesis protein [Sedimentisphaera salicampi]|uniref:lipopolysaccharide biosynthesis protein n=1 Tax=Sedimentisphaera salicampi TaxID=1941349 RepID=UPI000B9C15C3|nr:lipopolysaccharide biosynthesis protein [Sedimentisphaera salicampi]OXU15577.1 Lipopolysaccharide biosynthesis protein WzxC [Sedimentisphaera salicampi]
MTSNLKHQTVTGVFWRGLETCGRYGVQFVVSVVLARLLVPEQFGLIAMLTIFIQLSFVFIDSGFQKALIQKKDADYTDECSVFYLNIFVSVIVYAALFLCAPLVANFYEEPLLTPVLRVLALKLPIQALGQIQRALLTKKIDFKAQFFAGFGGMIISGGLGVFLAYADFGVWALVAQQITLELIRTVTFWLMSSWRPGLVFSIKSVKQLFDFGSRLLASGLLDAFFVNIYGLVIGKIFNPASLGFYNRGRSLPQMLMMGVNGTVMAVMFPVFSSIQDNPARLKSAAKRTLTTICTLLFPVMFGMAAVAEPLVRILLTDKWLPCVPYLQIMCFVYVTWPIHVGNLQIIMALGRSDVFLKLEIIKKINITIAILITFKFGVLAMVWGQLATAIIAVFLNSYYSGKFINYTTREQLKDLSPSALLAGIMAVLAYAAGLPEYPNVYVQFITQIAAGALVYIGGCIIIKLPSFYDAIDLVRGMLHGKLNALNLKLRT